MYHGSSVPVSEIDLSRSALKKDFGQGFIAGTYGDPLTTEAKETAIRLLLTQKLQNQVLFSDEKSTACLAFIKAYDVSAN